MNKMVLNDDYLRTSPFAVTSSVTRSVSKTTVSKRGEGRASAVAAVAETSAVAAVGRVSVGRAVGSNVGRLEVGHLGGVYHATVMGQGGGAVFQKTWWREVLS